MHRDRPAGRHAWGLAAVVAALLLGPPQAAAQSGQEKMEAGAHLVVGRSFDAGDAGYGGRVAWMPVAALGLEASLSVYPAAWAGGTALGQRSVEALFGGTIGPRLGRLRPFARVRYGILATDARVGGPACIAIYPPPLACVLAAGGTFPALDIGGGIDIAVGRRTFLRLAVADRLVRVQGPLTDRGGAVRDRSSVSHGFRADLGAGVRF